MGVFHVRARVFNLQDEQKSRELQLTVDSGATYPVIPADVARDLGLLPSEEITFTLADGSQKRRKVGWAGIAYDGRSTHTRIVFGEADDVPLLGSFALEGLGRTVDPVAKTLRPATQYLL